MKKRTRKILSLLLAVVVLLTMLPMTALAGTPAVQATGIQIMELISGTLVTANRVIQNTSYTVQIPVRNDGADTIQADVTLYQMYDSAETVVSTKSDSVEAARSKGYSFSWKPTEVGGYTLRAVVSVDGAEPVDDGLTKVVDVLDSSSEASSTHIFMVSASGDLTGLTNLDGTTASGEVVIPSSVGGVTVTKIVRTAFNSKPNITKITVPNTVAMVESPGNNYTSGGFMGCTNLTEVVFEDGGTTPLVLGNWSFSKLKKLTKVTLPTTRETTFGDNFNGNTFLNCSALVDVNFSESKLVRMYSASLQGCSSLESVTFPASLIELQCNSANGVFRDCTNLASVTFLNGNDAPLKIDRQTFYNLRKLESVTLPTGRPITFGDRVFEDCTALSSINLGACDVVSVGTTMLKNTALTDVTVNSRNAAVASDAFGGGEAPVILRGWYGSQAQSCAATPGVIFVPLDDINDHITDGEFVVSGEGELLDYLGDDIEVTIPISVSGQAVTKIGSYALRAHNDITYLDIKAQITEVSNYAFQSLNALKSLTMPQTLKKLGASSFEGCAGLERITFGANSALEEIGDRAFYNAAALIYIDLPETLKTIGTRAFYGSGFNYIDLPDSIESVGSHAFASSKLMEIELPECFADATLGTYLFQNCTQLRSIGLPEGLTTVGEFWFTGCSSLQEIDIPDTVTTLGRNAFQNSGLISLTIPAGVTEIPQVFTSGSAGLGTVSILGPVTAIGASAFSNCTSLNSVNLPLTLETLGNNAFSSTALKEAVIPNGATSLGGSAFSGCVSLEALVIPASVTTIGTSLVNNCNKDKLVVYVQRGSTAAASANINQTYATLRYPDFPIDIEVKGAAETLSDAAFTVETGAAGSYGLESGVKPYQVSVLDALILAHEQMYGWTPGVIGSELAVDENGQITRFFDIETNNAGFSLNGSPFPVSDAASTVLKDNDVLLLFTGKTAGGEEQGITWFEFGGVKQTSITFALNRTYELIVKTADGPVAGISVYMLDSSGDPVGDALGTTNSEGKVSVTFADAAGTRMIAGVDAQDRYFFSRLTVTVYEPDLMLQSVVFAGIPAFDTSSALSGGQTAGALVKADESGTDVSAGFDPAHGRYNVHVNANITSLRFATAILHNNANAPLKKISVYLNGSSSPMQGADSLTPNVNGIYTIPAFPFTGDSMDVRLTVRFTENGQDFEQSYDVHIFRDLGQMEPYAGILDIKGANRTSVPGIFKPGNTAASIYYDKGMTSAILDVKVQQGTEVYLEASGEAEGTLQNIFSGPALENGRQVVTYRLTLSDFTKSYVITARRDADESNVTISSFVQKSPYDGVYTPDRIVRYLQAPGQFVASTPGGTLLASTNWSKFFSLGGFGGYVDYYYDEPITDDPRNPYGVDFIIYGNAFSAGGAGEAAGVQVSRDGVTWYRLAGQRQYELSTYYDTAVMLDGSTMESQLIARKGEYGYMGAYPDKVSFGYVDISACSTNENAEGNYHVTARAGNPYRDISDRTAIVIGDGFDLAWAIDRNGRPVELSGGIRYIRVQNEVDAHDSAFGEVSTEIGTITRINPDTQLSPVGVTSAPEVLTVNETDILSLTPESTAEGGKVNYYELDLRELSDTVDVQVEGAEGDTIYVNAERYVRTADYTGLLDENGARTVRVIVQNGNKEPCIYVIRCYNGGDPAVNADLESVILTPGDVSLSQNDGVYTATVGNGVQKITLQVKTLNPNAVIKLDDETLVQNVASSAIPVFVGTNYFTLTVTSQNGSVTKSYPVVVVRKEADTATNMITVSFTFTGDVVHYIMNPDDKYSPGTSTGSHKVLTWIPKTKVIVPKGSTVKYVTDMMLMNAGLDFSSVGGTYIESVQIPGTDPPEYLSEFDNGPKSGWMYRHNNYIAGQGYADRVLKDGDTVTWFYTDDYTKERGYEGGWDNVNAGASPDSVPVDYDGWTNPFADVKSGDWFYDAVKYAVQKELFAGASAAAFSPNTPMTRAMLVTVLHRLDGKPAVTGANSFSDVAAGQWYTDAVIWANTNNIVSGYGNGKFGTNDSITREQMAAILYRYAEYKGYNVTKTAELSKFTDAASVSPWADSAMKWAVDSGLISGMTDTTLAPAGSATRAHVASILMRFAGEVAK